MTRVQERRAAARVTYAPVREAVTAAPRAATAQRGHRRQNALLAVVATVLGLWFGLAAPAVSPVGPPAPPPSDLAAVSQPAGPALQAPVPASPTGPAAGAGAEGRTGQVRDRNETDQQGRRR